MLFLLLYHKKNDILFEHCKSTVVAQHFYLCSSASSKEGWGEWGRQLEVSWQRTAWALREVTAEIRGSNLTQIFHFTLLCSESVQGEEVVIQGYESLWDDWHPFLDWKGDGACPLTPGVCTRAPDPANEFVHMCPEHSSKNGPIYGCQGSFGSPFFAIGLPYPQCACLVFSGPSGLVVRQ